MLTQKEHNNSHSFKKLMKFQAMKNTEKNMIMQKMLRNVLGQLRNPSRKKLVRGIGRKTFKNNKLSSIKKDNNIGSLFLCECLKKKF